MFDMDDYQKRADSTAIYPGKGTFVGLMYVALKGCGEAGEFAENVGKALRDDNMVYDHVDSNRFEFDDINEERREKLIKELGDRFWYIAAAATELGVTLSEVAEKNLSKLADRKSRGVLKGSGDER